MRKLAILTVSFSAAVFLANYIQSPYILLLTAASAAAAAMLIAHSIKIDRKMQIAMLFSFSLGFLMFFVYRSFTVLKAAKHDGCVENCYAVADDYCEEFESGERLKVTLQYGDLIGFRCYLYDSHGMLKKVSPGDTISFRALVQSVSEEQDSFDSYSSSGVFLKARLSSRLTFVSRRYDLKTLSARIRRVISDNCMAAFPEETSAFFTALLIGDKQGLYDNGTAYDAMSKAGIIHVVAISGMHVSFFVGLMLFLFGNTRKAALVCIPLMWTFVFVTGCSYSAVRAALMQTFLLTGPVFKRESDVLTSLFTALGLILLSNPFAAKSVSLQLSFAATTGICLFNNGFSSFVKNDGKNGPLAKLKKYAVGIIATSISSMVFTVPLCGIHFGFVSLISPLTNLLSLWAVTICFYLGVFAALSFSILPLFGVFIGGIASVFAKYILNVCSALSGFKYSCLYFSGFLSVFPVILIYICVVLLAFSDFRPLVRTVLGISFSVVCLSCFFLFQSIAYRIPDGVLTILNVGQGACASVYSHGRVIAVDCGSDSFDTDAAKMLLTQLRADGFYGIDALILTHYHDDHMNGLFGLYESGRVYSYVLPGIGIPFDHSDINALLEDDSQGKYLICENSELSIGDISVQLYVPFSESSNDNENCMSVYIKTGDYRALITGDSSAALEMKLMNYADLSDTDVLVAGHHGSNTSSAVEFVEFVSPASAVISVGKNFYGHPASETLEALSDNDVTLYRTDLNGRIRYSFYG